MAYSGTPEQIYNKALQAAKDAIAAEVAREPEDMNAFDCGFAWVVVNPAYGKFVAWCKANGHGSRHWKRGWMFWCPGQFRGQSVRIHKVGAVAFCKVLEKHGLNAHHDSRLD